jgi:hypothetical protein
MGQTLQLMRTLILTCCFCLLSLFARSQPLPLPIDSIKLKGVTLKYVIGNFYDAFLPEEARPGMYLQLVYSLRFSNRLNLAELHNQLPQVIKALKPDIEKWLKQTDSLDKKEPGNAYTWKRYYLRYCVGEWDGPPVWSYEIDARADTLVVSEPSFSYNPRTADIPYLYTHDYINKLTGLSLTQRKAIYDRMLLNMHRCAIDSANALTYVYDLTNPPGAGELKEWADFKLNSRKTFYYACFLQLFPRTIPAKDPILRKALFIEMCHLIGNEGYLQSIGEERLKKQQ